MDKLNTFFVIFNFNRIFVYAQAAMSTLACHMRLF